MHKITNVVSKSTDWKVVTILTADGDVMENVSVNRTNRKGEVFPNFDGIIVGATIAGTLWNSPAGKVYLFAPKGTSKPQAPVSDARATNAVDFKVIPELEQIKAGQAEIKFLIQALGERLERFLNAAIKPDITSEDTPF